MVKVSSARRPGSDAPTACCSVSLCSPDCTVSSSPVDLRVGLHYPEVTWIGWVLHRSFMYVGHWLRTHGSYSIFNTTFKGIGGQSSSDSKQSCAITIAVCLSITLAEARQLLFGCALCSYSSGRLWIGSMWH